MAPIKHRPVVVPFKPRPAHLDKPLHAVKVEAKPTAKPVAKKDTFEVKGEASVAVKPDKTTDSFQAKTNPTAAVTPTVVAPAASVDEADKALSTAQTEFNRTKGAVESNNKKLNQQLARVGPALTPDQKKAYIAQFRADHAEDYAANAAATTKLAEALKFASTLPAMPPSTTLRALEAAKALAATPEGAEAAKDFAQSVATKVEANPNYFIGGLNNLPHDQAVKELNTIVSTALPNIYSEQLRLADGDPKAAGAAFAAKVEGLERLRVFSSNGATLKVGIDALKAGDLKTLEGLEKNTPFGKCFAIAGVALSIAKLSSGADIDASDYLQTVTSLGKDGAELLATGMKVLASNARVGADVAEGLTAGASFLSRIAPGLGIAANSIQTVIDAGKLLGGEGNSGDAVAVVGDAMATVGSILSCTVIGEPIALPLQLIGAVIGKVGNMMSDSLNREQDIADTQKVLEETGLGDDASRIAHSDPAAVQTLATVMTPEEVQQVLRQCPDPRLSPEALKVLSDAMPPDEVKRLIMRNPDGFTSEYAAREYLAIRNRPYGYPAAHG
jgi:hypothetical protein